METTQFARVMRELGIQQIFALSPQAKGRVERMLETFQDRLVTELRLARRQHHRPGQGLVLQEFLPKINARFAVAAEQPEMAYRPVPAELSLTETICHQGHPQGGPGQHGEVPRGGPYSCCLRRSGPAMRASGWRSWNGPTGSCCSSTRERPWIFRRDRRPPRCCGAQTPVALPTLGCMRWPKAQQAAT